MKTEKSGLIERDAFVTIFEKWLREKGLCVMIYMYPRETENWNIS